MRRLSLLTLIVAALLAVPIGLVRAITYTNSPTSFALMFTAPDGSPCAQPCMFGIRPGETSFPDAIARLRAHPLTRNLRASRSISRNGMVFAGDPFSVGLSGDDNGRLIMIDVQLQTPLNGDQEHLPFSVLQSTTFAEMMLTLGIPDYVEFGRAMSGNTVESYYQSLNLHIIHEARSELRVDPNLPLLYAFMYVRSADVTPQLVPWMGFASLDRYLNAQASLFR